MKTTKRDKPIITLKSVKYSAFASKETHCFQAVIYVDGIRWATVTNEGHGGCDHVRPIEGSYDAVTDMEDWIGETYPKWGAEFNRHPHKGNTRKTTLEIVVGDLMNQWHRDQAFKKTMRRICYIKPGEDGIYQMGAKYKPTASMIARIKEDCAWAAGAIFFHDLTLESARELFDKHGQ